MHFAWFSMRDGFFSHHKHPNPARVACDEGAIRRRTMVREIHLTWKTIQNAFSRILYTLRHVNHAKYMYIAQS